MGNIDADPFFKFNDNGANYDVVMALSDIDDHTDFTTLFDGDHY